MNLSQVLGRKVLFHWVGWHGKDGKASIPGYISTSPDTIGDQLTAMQTLGGDGAGVIALTYGPFVSEFIHAAVMEMCAQCSERTMPFALCFDPWTVKSAVDKNKAMIAAIQHPDTQAMLNSRSYLAGKPVLDFATGVDPKAMANLGVQYWMNGPDFAWPRIPGPTNNNVKLPCVCLQFNDGTGADRNKQVWDQTKPVRLLPSRAGGLFWDLAASAGEYVQFVTWNDYAEGTEIEPVAAMLSGRIG